MKPALDGRDQPIQTGDTIVTHTHRWPTLYVAKVDDTKGQKVKLGEVESVSDDLCDLKAGMWISASECVVVNQLPFSSTRDINT